MTPGPSSPNSPRPRPWASASRLHFVAGAIALGLSTWHCDNDGLRADEIHCEEALAHILDCCPTFDVNSVGCQWQTSIGCGFAPSFGLGGGEDSGCSSSFRGYSEAQSAQILKDSCEQIHKDYACQ